MFKKFKSRRAKESQFTEKNTTESAVETGRNQFAGITWIQIKSLILSHQKTSSLIASLRSLKDGESEYRKIYSQLGNFEQEFWKMSEAASRGGRESVSTTVQKGATGAQAASSRQSKEIIVLWSAWQAIQKESPDKIALWGAGLTGPESFMISILTSNSEHPKNS
jgi:hypothetical protein